MRRDKEHLEILKQLNVNVISARQSGKHHVLRCEGPGGERFQTVFAKTPGDHRSLLNWRSDVRRAMGGRK